MTQNKHTPAPWKAVSMSGIHGHSAIMADGPEFQDSETWPYHPKIASIACMRGGPSREIGEANATLVAAAPDLLDAAKGYVLALDQWENSNKAEKRVERAESALRAAIAKAEGKQ